MKKIVQRTRGFEKSFELLSKKQQQKFIEKLEKFLENELDPFLKIHPLKGNMKDLWAFSVTGDVRAIYKKIKGTEIIIFTFVDIGKHTKVYI